jgi:hypothetical protein
MEIDFNYYNWGPLLCQCRLTQDQLNTLKQACDRADRYFEHDLFKLNKEYVFTEQDYEHFKKALQPYLDGYVHVYNNNWSNLNLNGSFELGTIWVNFQQEKESRPIHIHSNCDASFVIYVDIPESIKEEHRADHATDMQPGTITFRHASRPDYSDILKDISTQTFFPRPGDMFIFPYSLEHFTTPFYGEGARISVSGNLKYVERKQ